MPETHPPKASDTGSKIPIDFLETERLLLPISENEPVGVFLRYDETYDKIREAAREEDPSLPQGIWQRDLKKADWHEVCRLCFDTLENRSKDLQIAAWMLEALLHLYEFEGVDRGLRLLIGLCERFWDIIYPEIDEDDPEIRISPFIWLNEKLPVKLKSRPVTMPPSGETCVPITFLDYEKIRMTEKAPEKDKAKAKRDKETQELTDRSIKTTPIAFHKKQLADIDSSLQRLSALERHLDEKCGRDAPGFSQFREALESVRFLAEKFLREKPGGLEALPVAEEIGTENFGYRQDGEEIFETHNSGMPVRSREQAYRVLSETADWLASREPHSPVPLLIRRAVSWGNMDFPELLRELVTDGSVLKQITDLLRVDGGEEPQKK